MKSPTPRSARAVFSRPVFVSVGLLLLSLPVSAQQVASSAPENVKPEGDVQNLDPFVVTAETDEGYSSKETAIGSRSVKAIMDLPTSIAVVNRELIDDLGATFGGEAVKYGVSGAVRNQTITDDTFFRGFRSIQPLRNGVQIPATRRNPMFDVERIEVIKGPSSMLLGNVNYLGGALNYVTRKPTATRKGDVKVTAGTDGYLRAEANSSGPILRSGDLSVSYRVTLGSENGEPRKIQESIDQKFASGAISVKYNDRVFFDTTVATYVDNGYQYWSDFLDRNRSVPFGTPILNQYSTASFSPSLGNQVFMDTDWFFINSSLSAKVSDNGHFNLYYTFTKVTLFEDVISGSELLADNVTLTRGFFHFKDESVDQNLQAQYLYRTVKDSWRNDFQVGGDWNLNKGRNGYAPSAAPAINTANPDYTFTPPPWDEATFRNGPGSRGTVGSYWFQDNLTVLNDKLILIGGLRWTDSRVLAYNSATDTGTYRPSKGPTRTHRYGAVYKPLSGVSIYVADAQNLTPILGLDDFGQPLKDQAGKLKELGVKLSRKVHRFDLQGSVAYFDMSLTNAYSQEYNQQLGRVISIQTASDTSKGLEVDFSGRINDLPSGYADFIVTCYNADSYSVATKRRPQEVPERVYSFLGKYTWTAGPLKGLSLGGGVYNESEKFDGSDPVSGNPYVLDIPPIYSVMARYTFGAWTFQVNGRNVTDERHIVRIASPALVMTDVGAEWRFAASFSW